MLLYFYRPKLSDMKWYSILLILTVLQWSCLPDSADKKPTPDKTSTEKKAPVKKKKKTSVTSKGDGIKVTEANNNYSESKANSTIDYRNIDLQLLEQLLHEEINKVRRANQLSILGKNNILRNAAVDQNNYQLTVKELTHQQKTPGKENLIDRVRHYGGGFQLMAENLIYEGFTVRTINGVKAEIFAPTYREMAKTMTKNWLGSPPHRKNILQSELKLVGTAMAFNAENYAIYATQVFGTKL